MQVGDLVKTRGFGPKGSVGEIGILVHDHPSYGDRVWTVAFGSKLHWISADSLEVINASR